MENSNYRILQTEKIEELNATFHLWQHILSGAYLLHLEADNPENVFALSLATYPSNSRGVAHILEHMVLCGSKKYPVKDPFFSMIRRSLNTFMNAFTGSDFTCYPAASQNRLDFYQLLDVYIDAVFFPNLDARSFAQEGHRLEWKDKKILQGLERSGIVYNEMKGAYISPQTHLWNEIHGSLLEDTCYHFDSGGNPKNIPELTHEELLAFHKTYYHPSRCLFFFYGNIDTASHGDFLHNRLLKDVVALPHLPKRAEQTRWRAPRAKQGIYPSSGEDTEGTESSNKPMAAISWLTHSISQTRENLLIDLLDYLLMGHDGAPLKRYLLESGVCEHASSNLEHEMLEIPYTIVLRDCSAEDLPTLQKNIFEELHRIHQVGFSRKALEAALHQLKLSRLEITGGGYPFGLTLFFRSGLARQQGANPLDSLRLHTHLDSLQSLLDNPQELLDIFKKQLLDNSHRLDLWLNPDPTWANRAKLEESSDLQALEQTLDTSQKQAIARASLDLENEQNSEENRDILPKMNVADIDRHPQDFILQNVSPATYCHVNFTNGFVYSDLHVHLPKSLLNSLTSLEWHELKLLAYLWTRLGAANRNYEKQLEVLDLYTGGLASSLDILLEHDQHQASHGGHTSLTFSLHTLSENSKKGFSLLQESILEGRLDEKDRIVQLLDMLHSSLRHQLPSHALSYALSASSAHLGSFAALSDWLSGLPFAQFVIREAQQLAQGPDALIGRLQRLKSKVLQHLQSSLVLSCDSKDLDLCKPALTNLHQSLPILHGDPHEASCAWLAPSFTHERAYALNSQVHFIALTLPAPHLHHPDAMALRLACEVIKHQVLHPEIREKGGAYGYGCSYSPDKPCISFHSYRDPHLARTLDVFRQGVDKIADEDFQEEALDEAKRCWIQKLDKPLIPGEKASVSYAWYLSQLNQNTRKMLREKLLDMSMVDVQKATKKWMQEPWNLQRVCIFGPKENIEKTTSFTAHNPLNISH